ncbi:MAG: hypothetical protein ACKESB_03250 [Candidatus Hodgkinia cicadicola]
MCVSVWFPYSYQYKAWGREDDVVASTWRSVKTFCTLLSKVLFISAIGVRDGGLQSLSMLAAA